MGSGEFLSIDFFTALFTLLNTLVLFFVLKKVLWGPVMKMIEDRQQEIDDLYADADKTRQEAEKLHTEYREKMSEAAQIGERMIKEAAQRGQERETEILRLANVQADAIRQKAQEAIAREKEKALSDAKNEIAGLAMEIAGKVVSHSLQIVDQKELVDRFIEELGEA